MVTSSSIVSAGSEAGPHGVEAAVLEGAVALDVVVLDAAVEPRADRDRARPVLREDGGLEAGEVRVAHVHEPPLSQGGLPAGLVAEARAAGEHAGAQVEGVAVLEHLDAVQRQPRSVLDADAERKSVRGVDHALGLNAAVADRVRDAVEAAGDVRARVMDAVGIHLRERPARREAAVADRAQRLAEALAAGS